MYSKYAELRDLRNLNDAQVAKETGIPAATLSDWKNNKSTPKMDKLVKLADYFSVSLDELVRG